MRFIATTVARALVALVLTVSVLVSPVVGRLPTSVVLAASTAEAPFWMTTPLGHVFGFNNAPDFGSLKGLNLNLPIVGMTPTPSNNGYWLVASDGGIFAFGDAAFYGSTGNIRLNQPIVGMAPTPTNNGYWMVARDGGIFAYGDARFFGSTGAIRLNQPIVAMASTPTNNGYWLVASDGGIFAFGDARFFGSTGAIRLNSPIVGMAPTPTNNGYWLVAEDGGIFAFGDATFYGSAGGGADRTYVKIVASPDGKGYWLIRNGGDAIAFGSAGISSSASAKTNRRPSISLIYGTKTRGDVAVDYALKRMDVPYKWGGNGPDGYDCSGLTSQAWKAAGVSLPRVANDQYDIGSRVPLDQLRPGDLLFWGPDRGNSRSIDHVGMYIGGGWAINSGGQSTPSRVSLRSVSATSGWMFPYGVRPAS